MRYETWCYSVLSVYCWHVFCFGFLCMFDVCIIGKTTVLFICIHKRVKSIVFVVSIKFCYKLGQAILKRYMYYGSLETVAEKICIINQQNHLYCILKPICTCKYDNDISSIPHDLYDWFLLTAIKLFYQVKVTDNRWSGKKPLYWLGLTGQHHTQNSLLFYLQNVKSRRHAPVRNSLDASYK